MLRTRLLPIMLAACLTLCLFVVLVPHVRADATTESFTIYTDSQSYQVGDTVNIYVKANSIDRGQTITITDVVVYGPDSSVVAKWHGLSIELVNTVTPMKVGTLNATIVGTYTVTADATGCAYRLHSECHFYCQYKCPKSVPDFPLGTIGAMTSLFGAMGLYITRKKYLIKT